MRQHGLPSEDVPTPAAPPDANYRHFEESAKVAETVKAGDSGILTRTATAGAVELRELLWCVPTVQDPFFHGIRYVALTRSTRTSRRARRVSRR